MRMRQLTARRVHQWSLRVVVRELPAIVRAYACACRNEECDNVCQQQYREATAYSRAPLQK